MDLYGLLRLLSHHEPFTFREDRFSGKQFGLALVNPLVSTYGMDPQAQVVMDTQTRMDDLVSGLSDVSSGFIDHNFRTLSGSGMDDFDNFSSDSVVIALQALMPDNQALAPSEPLG